MNRACRMYGSSIRLPMNVSHAPETTPTFPRLRASRIAVATASLEVSCPRTISISRVASAGNAKCAPMTSRGRRESAAIPLTSSAVESVARIAPLFITRSSFSNTLFLASRSPDTDSMTKSASAISP